MSLGILVADGLRRSRGPKQSLSQKLCGKRTVTTTSSQRFPTVRCDDCKASRPTVWAALPVPKMSQDKR